MKTLQPMARASFVALACALLIFLAPRVSAAPKGSPWNENYFPNVTLVSQDGKEMRFYDDMIKGKIVLINFMFATCHDACPLETAKLRQVQEQLGDRVGKEVFMYSITITPEHDTPEVLKEYMEQFKVAPGWQFMTGKIEDINLIRKKLGLYEEGEVNSDHTQSLMIGNESSGTWMKRSSFDNPRVLSQVMLDRLMGGKVRIGGVSYAEAPTQINVDPGEDLFRRRCQECHTVGRGEAIGPDLAGVTTRRGRTWLSRYIQAPNKLLEQGDAIAVALNEKYRKLPMPNLSLTGDEVDQVVGYLENENQRLVGKKTNDAKNETNQHQYHMHAH
jgi:protein SCO1